MSGSLIVGLGQAGNQKLGVWVLIAINLVHIPLLLMLALGWWTHHPMGILGAGISSFLSDTAGLPTWSAIPNYETSPSAYKVIARQRRTPALPLAERVCREFPCSLVVRESTAPPPGVTDS